MACVAGFFHSKNKPQIFVAIGVIGAPDNLDMLSSMINHKIDVK